jgi:hypothetical protein
MGMTRCGQQRLDQRLVPVLSSGVKDIKSVGCLSLSILATKVYVFIGPNGNKRFFKCCQEPVGSAGDGVNVCRCSPGMVGSEGPLRLVSTIHRSIVIHALRFVDLHMMYCPRATAECPVNAAGACPLTGYNWQWSDSRKSAKTREALISPSTTCRLDHFCNGGWVTAFPIIPHMRAHQTITSVYHEGAKQTTFIFERRLTRVDHIEILLS